MENVTEINLSNYGYSFIRIGDERVKQWLLMGNPIYLVLIILSYLTIIYKIGPKWMENRKPFNLKFVLAAYNLLQILSCCYFVNAMLSPDSYNPLIFWKCYPMDYGLNEKAITTLKYTHQLFLLKILELIETIFFVMRKKSNQISKLHVYHHASTVAFAWIMVKYHGGGMILFSCIVNSFVHIIMYSYYFLAVFGPEIQNKLLFVKKSITVIQMIQFCFILTQCIIGISCGVPKLLLAIYVPNVAIIFYMFYDFFQKAYGKKETKVK